MKHNAHVLEWRAHKARSGWICNALTYPMVTGMLVAGLTLGGCTVVQEKGRAYRDAAENFANPDKIRICYDRAGEATRGMEYRCFGEGCEVPECPK